MKYEISEEDWSVLRAACLTCYMALSEETNGVVSAEMGMVRDMFHRLEEQRPPEPEEPVIEIPEGAH